MRTYLRVKGLVRTRGGGGGEGGGGVETNSELIYEDGSI